MLIDAFMHWKRGSRTILEHPSNLFTGRETKTEWTDERAIRAIKVSSNARSTPVGSPKNKHRTKRSDGNEQSKVFCFPPPGVEKVLFVSGLTCKHVLSTESGEHFSKRISKH